MQDLVADKYQKRLKQLKKWVEEERSVWDENYKNFHMMKKFICDNQLTDDDRASLDIQGKPEIQINILEPFGSRLLGEFSKQEPEIEVSGSDGYKPDGIMVKTIECVESHMRAIFYDSKSKGTGYNTYKDQLYGGWSVFKVFTKYINEKSFDQVIGWENKEDPTLCGFDLLSKLSDKSDGRFSYELYPVLIEDLEKKYGIKRGEVSFSRSNSGFTWAYQSNSEKIALVCEFYEKVKTKVKIVLLSNYKTMELEKYEKMIAEWDEVKQPPQILQTRMTDKIRIDRYIFIENKVLEYKKTNLRRLPHIFVDGNSVMLKDSDQIKQKTRSYFHNAVDIQRLKNYSAQCLGNELENMIQHKLIIAEEAISPNYSEALTNMQIPAVIVHRAFKNNDPNIPVPSPREVVRTPGPPEIMQTFVNCDQMIQNVLGSYDAALGINNNQLSGTAIEEGATQSNAAAMPYIVSYLLALNTVAETILELMPLYYVTPRTIPIIGKDGERDYMSINDETNSDSVMMDFEEGLLKVKVEAGLNFSVQKSRAMQQIIALQNASPIFAQFMNAKGLKILLDNVDIKGVDLLKLMADQFMDEMDQQQKMQMQMQMQAQQQQQSQPNPMMIKMQLDMQMLEHKKQESDMQYQLKMKDLALREKDLALKEVELQLKATQAGVEGAVSLKKAQTEENVHAMDALVQLHDQKHRHAKESIETVHKINTENRKLDNEKEKIAVAKSQKGLTRKKKGDTVTQNDN